MELLPCSPQTISELRGILSSLGSAPSAPSTKRLSLTPPLIPSSAAYPLSSSSPSICFHGDVAACIAPRVPASTPSLPHRPPRLSRVSCRPLSFSTSPHSFPPLPHLVALIQGSSTYFLPPRSFLHLASPAEHHSGGCCRYRRPHTHTHSGCYMLHKLLKELPCV